MMRTTGRMAVLAAVLVTALLSGCAPTAPSIDPSASERLGADVLAVTTAAAAGDYATAMAALDTVQGELDAAIAADDVSAARAAEIRSAIDLVRADLAAAVAPAVTPEPAVTPTPEDHGDDKKGKDCPDGKDSKGKGKDACKD